MKTKTDNEILKEFYEALKKGTRALALYLKELSKVQSKIDILSRDSHSVTELLKSFSIILHNQAKDKRDFIEGYAVGKNLPLTLRALNRATEWHFGQFRDDGTEYITHPVDIWMWFYNHGCFIDDDVVYAAILLHDILEDVKGITVGMIKEEFNEEVACLVIGKTKNKIDEQGNVLEERYDNEEFTSRILQDPRLILLQVVDRGRNVTDSFEGFTLERMIAYVQETEEYVFPLIELGSSKYREFKRQFNALERGMIPVIENAKSKIESELGKKKALKKSSRLQKERDELKEKVKKLVEEKEK